MSFRVLVIPEDPTQNGYIPKPLVRAVVGDAGRPRARVEILSNPRIQGYDQAVRAIREDLAARYWFWDLWLFFPDADRASWQAMRDLERTLEGQRVRLRCCPAQPEVEIYACAGFVRELREPWDQARADPRLKEQVFLPLLQARGDPDRPGQGRDLLIAEALQSLPGLYRLCPELRELRDRIERCLGPTRE
jgi:hypothetical protein